MSDRSAQSASIDREHTRAHSRAISWALAAIACVALHSLSLAQSTDASIASPNKILAVRIALDAERRPFYTVERQGRELIAPSRLGFLFTNSLRWERNIAITSSSQRSNDSTWEQPWGERRYVRDHYNELRVRLTETNGAKRSIDVVFRVFDDGVGFRYEFPEQSSLRDVAIAEELTEFAVAEPATAWWIPAGEWNRYEYLYSKTPLTEVGQAHTPMTIRTQSGIHIAFHEAALVDYSSMWLRRVDGQRLKAELSPSGSGAKVTRTAPFTTPWRTMQIAPTAGGLVASDLILNLNEPNALGDVSWVTPYKYVGVWWGMHIDTETWASGARHGANTKNVMRYIDFAAKHGFRGVLVEGWNVGWDGDWFANGDVFSFTKPFPDFDIEKLAA
jgi:alpha-glucosidase